MGRGVVKRSSDHMAIKVVQTCSGQSEPWETEYGSSQSEKRKPLNSTLPSETARMQRLADNLARLHANAGLLSCRQKAGPDFGFTTSVSQARPSRTQRRGEGFPQERQP